MKKTHLILVGLLLSFTLNATNDIPRPEYPETPSLKDPNGLISTVNGHMSSISPIRGKAGG